VTVRQRLRFRQYHVKPDETATVIGQAWCCTDETECQWTSGERTRADDLTALIAKHAAETEHQCYRRTATDYATAVPGDWV
jgi:hypothetical protein